MATPALIVVITVALLTLVALSLTIVVLVRHLRGLSTTLAEMQDNLAGPLDRIAADAEVTQAELQRVSDRAAGLSDDRTR